jgi:hypothetical protein
MKPDNGSSAFPIPTNESSDFIRYPGMTLRDWFAGHALTGLIIRGNHPDEYLDTTAYEIADAMLKARAQ